MKPKQKIVVALLVSGIVLGFGIQNHQELKRIARPVTWPIKTRLFHPVLAETQETHSIATLLKVIQAYDEKGPIELRRIGRLGDGGYVIPEIAMQAADAIIGYGISDDISFEELATTIYGKPSWGFDGTCPSVETKHEQCHFIPLCIASQESLKNDPKADYASFDQQREMFGFKDKQLFIKMDIEGNEYDALPDLLNHAKNITGIALELHFSEDAQLTQAVNLLKMLDKDFLLVHAHGNNYCLDHFVTSNSTGRLTRVMELSYINKTLVRKYEIAQNQTHPTPLDMPNAKEVPDVEFTILN